MDEQDVELIPSCLKTLDRASQPLSQQRMRIAGALNARVDVRLKLNVASATCAPHMDTEDTMKARPLRKVFLPLLS